MSWSDVCSFAKYALYLHSIRGSRSTGWRRPWGWWSGRGWRGEGATLWPWRRRRGRRGRSGEESGARPTSSLLLKKTVIRRHVTRRSRQPRGRTSFVSDTHSWRRLLSIGMSVRLCGTRWRGILHQQDQVASEAHELVDRHQLQQRKHHRVQHQQPREGEDVGGIACHARRREDDQHLREKRTTLIPPQRSGRALACRSARDLGRSLDECSASGC